MLKHLNNNNLIFPHAKQNIHQVCYICGYNRPYRMYINMDQRTIHAYNQDAAQIATLHASLIPRRLYDLIQTYFIAHGKTLDAGCGIGRDSFFLQQNHFDVIGIVAIKTAAFLIAV